MRAVYYLLDVNKKPYPVYNHLEFAKLYRNDSSRIVEQTTLLGDVKVSTVFLGIDHSFLLEDEPVLFETMVFGGEEDMYCQRYATWDAAAQGHKRVCQQLTDGQALTKA